ncbi:MAG: glycosyltransferase [Clostridia bacterium]|nr:glycosyltransferase [Clostridia bacterium]
MKVLQINVVYKTGSTGKIMYDIHNELCAKGIDSRVCYSRSMKATDHRECRVCRKAYSRINSVLNQISGSPYGGCFFSTRKLIRYIKEEQPDIVHLHCLNGSFVNIYKLIEFLKVGHYKTVLTLHAEFMYTGGCGYAFDCTKWAHDCCAGCEQFKAATGSLVFNRAKANLLRMIKAFEHFESLEVVGVSNWITNRALKSAVFSGKRVQCVHNGINLDAFAPIGEEEKIELKEKLGIGPEKKVIITVNPRFNDPVKGGDIFVKLAHSLPDGYLAVLVGSQIDDEKIVSIPFVNNQKELAAYYSMADCFAMCSRTDNYPTVCIEANSCGTPVVAFDVGGVPETIGEGIGEVVPAFDIDKMIEKVVYWSNQKKDISRETIKAKRDYCDKKRMADDYMRIYDQI